MTVLQSACYASVYFRTQPWENIRLEENCGEAKRVVVFPNNAKAVVKDSPKTEASERTFIISAASKSGRVCHPWRRRMQPRFLLHISKNLLQYVQKTGYLRQIQQPRLALHLRFAAERTGNGFRTGEHTDIRMVETTYARTRHAGVMKQRQPTETLNAFL